MHVTEYYNIPKPVPFLDVDVFDDKPMFVDPRAIRLSKDPQPFASDAVTCLESFFHEIAACALSTRSADRRRGLELLQRFEEPWETRLGLAASGIQGHGGAGDVGQWIWDAFTTDARMFVDVGILTQVEDIPLFVEGVAADITSDLTTRIVFKPLADFTAHVLSQYPQFTAAGHRVETVPRQVWDCQANAWTEVDMDLPVVQDRQGREKPLLLIPQHWARGTLLMSSGRFYETSVLGYAQAEQTVYTEAGKALKPRKEDLAEQEALARGRETIMEVVLRAHQKGENLVKVFKSFVDKRYEPLSDETIDRKLR